MYEVDRRLPQLSPHPNMTDDKTATSPVRNTANIPVTSTGLKLANIQETSHIISSPVVDQNEQLPSQHANIILGELNKQRLAGKYTDVVLSCQGNEFQCHKAVLAASSQYFQERFDQIPGSPHDEPEKSNDIICVDDIVPVLVKSDSPSEVAIDNVQPSSLQTIVHFVYTSRVDVCNETAADLLSAGTILQYPDIISACCDFLQNNLSPATCLTTSQLAWQHNCIDLYHCAWQYALDNFQDVVLEETFLSMHSEQLLKYVASEKLQIRCEDEVFQAMMKWVNYYETGRSSLVPKLLAHIHLILLSDNLLQDALQNSTTIRSSQESLDMLKDANNLKDLARKAKHLGSYKLKPRLSTFTEVLVVIGGMRTDRSWSSDVVYFNPSQAQWNHLTELPFQTTDYSVAALDTSIYIIGGYKKEAEEATSEVWKYDTLLEEWLEIRSLNIPRFNHTSTTLDGCVYVIGGENDEVGLTELEMYDPVTNTWKILGNTNEMESNITAAGMDQKLYITGWLVHPRQTCVTQCFDLVSKECVVLPSSGLNRQIFPTVILNGNIYLLGASRIKEVSMYSPTTYKATKVEAMRYKRNSPSAAVVRGKIYVTGGELRHHLDKAEVYDADSDTWFAIPSMPEGLCFHGSVGVLKYLGPPFQEPLPVEAAKKSSEQGAAGDACTSKKFDIQP